MQTLAIPAVGIGEASRLIQAPPDKWMRVLVRNTGGTVLLLATDNAALSSLSSLGATYQLPPGQSDAIVVSPGQSLFAAGNGGGGQASIAISMAIPISSIMES
jgi:hypothetical protein